MNESTIDLECLDPECKGETFHTRDFLMFKKVREQYENDLKTDKIFSLNYTKEFFKKYLFGNELYKKLNRINTIIDKRLNNECKDIINQFSKDDYQFDIKYLNAELVDSSDYTITNIGTSNDSYSMIESDLLDSYCPDIPTKLEITYNNIGLLMTFKYVLVTDNYCNQLYKIFGLPPTEYVSFMFSHYYSPQQNRCYQYLYIINSDRYGYVNDTNSKFSGVVLYHNACTEELIPMDRVNHYKVLGQYSNFREHSIFVDDWIINKNLKSIKCDKPIFDDYILPLIRFYSWSMRKQHMLKNHYTYPEAVPSYQIMHEKWCIKNNISLDNKMNYEKDFLKECFMYDKYFKQNYNSCVKEDDLSTQWYTQILFSIVMYVLEKSVSDFISNRDNLVSRSETRFSKSNEVMNIDHIVNSFKDQYCH